MRERIIKYSMLDDYVITEEKKKKGGVNTLMRKARETHVKNRQGNGLVSSSSTESTSQNEFFGSYFIGI